VYLLGGLYVLPTPKSEITRKFEKIRTKIGNNPVDKKVNTPKRKYLGKYLYANTHDG